MTSTFCLRWGFLISPPPSLVFVYVYGHFSVWMYASAYCGEKRPLIPWSWSFAWMGAPRHRYSELISGTLQKQQGLLSPSCCPVAYFLKQSRLTGQSSSHLPALTSHFAVLQILWSCLAFYVGSRQSNAGPHTCEASAVQSEPTSQPQRSLMLWFRSL